MEDPATWQNPSQSFGYTIPQNSMSSKTPSASNTQVSPTKSGSYRLRWHNSVAEDYSFMEGTGASLKRSASMALPETTIDYPDQYLDTNAITPPKSSLHTKKRKQSATSSISSTPGKLKHVSDKAFDHASTASGIQTPPPTNQTGKRRRGRPPKNPPNAGASQIEFVNESASNHGGEFYDTTPSRTAELGTNSSPTLHQTESFMSFPNHGIHAGDLETLGGIDFHTNKQWDTSFAGSMMAENAAVASSFASLGGEVDIFSATATFDWSLLPTSQSVMDPLSAVDSFYHDSAHVDPLGFSFAQDPLSASDIISPGSVDPNVIFAGQHLASHYNDHFESSHLYQSAKPEQRDQTRPQQKRKDKGALPRAQIQSLPKLATPVAPSRPVMKRALTESALTKSAGSFKASNATVRPNQPKDRGLLSGKLKPAFRDENTTPSPIIDSGSVPQVSPQSHQSKQNSRKIKTAVSFSISPGGRAKAERVVVQESETHSDVEDQRDYDEDSSTDEDDPDTHLPRYAAASRSKGRHTSSSSLSRSMERPKIARYRTAPASSFSASSQFLMSGDFTSDSFNLEHNPFVPHNMSMSSLNKSPRRKSTHSRHHSKSSSFHSVKSGFAPPNATNLGSMREEDEYSESETVVDEPTYKTPGDAILALKQAVARRNSYNPTAGASRRPPSSYGTSRPSTRHTNFLPSSPPMQHAQPYGFSTPQTVRSEYSSDPFISPTTVTDPDCVTPSTYGGKQFGSRQSDIAIDMRCRCSSAGSPEMPVLQCNACFKWLHVQCEGYAHKPIPPSVICSFCKGGWQGPQPSQRVFRKPSLPQNISPLEARSFSA